MIVLIMGQRYVHGIFWLVTSVTLMEKNSISVNMVFIEKYNCRIYCRWNKMGIFGIELAYHLCFQVMFLSVIL